MIDISFEKQYAGKIVAGVDEVGRGPLAGPVIAAAVIIDQSNIINGINDSKKISKIKRELLNDQILKSYNYSLGISSVEEIDEFNILNATKLSIMRAIENLSIKPDIVLIDGNMKFIDKNFISIIKGDEKCYSIAAASIVAKVYRDDLMRSLALDFPFYKWDKNSGYGTIEHIKAIQANGISKHHRKKFTRKIEF